MGKKYTKEELKEYIFKKNPIISEEGLEIYLQELKDDKKYSYAQFQKIVDKKMKTLRHMKNG